MSGALVFFGAWGFWVHPFDFGDPVGAVPSAAELWYPNGVLRTSILAYGWDTTRWKLVESWLRPSFWRAREFSYGGDLFMYGTDFKLSNLYMVY